MANSTDEQVIMLKNLLRSAAKELLAHRSGAVIWRDVAEVLVDNDVMVVVRCKDCKHWKQDKPGCTDFVGYCGIANYMIGATGYCLYGERKENG